jgi:hypothetical protein
MLEKLPEFMANNSMLFVAVGVIVGLIIINEWRIRSRGFSSILPTEVVQKINQGAKVLDIRAESIFKQGHIVDSLHMPNKCRSLHLLPFLLQCLLLLTLLVF